MGWENFHSQRYVLATMAFLSAVNAYTLRTCLTMTITVMVHRKVHNKVDPYACPGVLEASKNQTQQYDLDWNEAQQGIILSSFYWGYIIMHIPGGLLAQKFGGKQTLGIGSLISSVAILLSPLAALKGVWCFIFARFVLGLAQGTLFPAISQLLAVWIPAKERGRVGSFVFAGVQVGQIASSVGSGYLLAFTNKYWPGVFYFWGTIGLVWFMAWCLICSNDPATHPHISQKEKDYLEKEIGGLSRRSDLPSTPWLRIATSPPLIACVITQVGHDWGLFTMSLELPKYFHSVLKYKISSNGLLSALPFLLLWIFAQVAGVLSDMMVTKQVYSLTTTRKIFTTIGQTGPAIGLILGSFAGCHKALTVTMFSIGMGLMGFYYPSIRVNTLDLSPNYAATLMALVNGIGAISGALSPSLVGFLIPNSTLIEWRYVFWMTFIAMVSTNIIYLLLGTAEIQPWNDPVPVPPPETPSPPPSDTTSITPPAPPAESSDPDKREN